MASFFPSPDRGTVSKPLAVVAFLLMGLVATSASIVSAASTVAGTVFQDFNSNGARDTEVTATAATDIGVSGIEVRAYDSTGAQVGNATSGGDGTYLLTVSGNASTQVRIEFTIPSTNPLSEFVSSFAGTSSGTSIQFVSVGASNVDYGISVPGEYCQNNPNLSVSRLCAGATSAVNSSPTVWVTNYNGGPYTTAHGWTDVYTNWTSNTAGTKTDTGSILGMTWDRSTGRVYNSAYVRRHAELFEQSGTPRPGAIFVTTPNGTNSTQGVGGTTQFLVDLETLMTGDQFSNSNASGPGYIPTNAVRDIAHMVNGTVDGGVDNDGVDSDVLSGKQGVFEEVGKTGIGDIENDEKGNLFVVSLYDKKLYKVAVPATGAPTTMTSLGIISDGVTCTNGVARPFSVKRWRGALYLGVVCDGSGDFKPSSPGTVANTNLSFTIKKYDLSTSTWSTFYGPHPLNSSGNINKGYPAGTYYAYVPTFSVWNPWSDAFDGYQLEYITRPQPMLTEIEFDRDGSMILLFRDRTGDQISTNQSEGPDGVETRYPSIASGDMYRICRSGAGYATSDYTFEGRTGCPQTSTAQGNGTEYYTGDFWSNATTPVHGEISVGLAAYAPGFRDVLLNSFDPYEESSSKSYYSGGFKALTNSTGESAAWPNTGSGVMFYANASNANNPNTAGGFMKTNGMADIEVLCDQAPIQIGNRLWYDSDKDGIQDAGERPITGVTVHLYDSNGTTLLGTAVTDAKGTYYFNSNLTEVSAGDGDNVGGGLTVGQVFVIKLDLASDFASGGGLHECELTSTDAVDATSALDDAIDNDATKQGSTWVITTRLTQPGINDHTYDFGCHNPAIAADVSAPTTTVLQATATTTQPSSAPAPTTAPTLAPASASSAIKPTTPTGSVSVGDFVWRDRNGDGLQGPIDRGVRGAILRLTTPSGETVTDIFGREVKPIITKKDGKYLFTNLPPGQYVVKITYPTGFKPTVANKPNRARNSSNNRVMSLNLRAGQSDRTLDFGVVGSLAGILPPTR